MRITWTGSMLGLLLAAAPAQATWVGSENNVKEYNFESLTAVASATSATAAAALSPNLTGPTSQDGWTSDQSNHLGFNVENYTGGQTGYTHVARAYYHNIANNQTFSTTGFYYDLAGQSTVVVETSMTPGRLGGTEQYIGIGNAANHGPCFGFFSGAFMIRPLVDGGTRVTVARAGTDALNDWYLFRFVINTTANGGLGSGDLYVQNLTDGESTWRTIDHGRRAQSAREFRVHKFPRSLDTRWLF